MKPLYIVGTQRDVGKTTLSLGLLHAFQQRGLRVAYAKPLGQRLTGTKGHIVHDDARVMASFLGLDGTQSADMAIPLPPGRVEQEIKALDTGALAETVRKQFEPLARDHEAVILEAMGHVAMGSCLGLSAGDVARHCGARALLISGGGIGRAIDEISLCATFLQARGADLMGVVVNKVWPEKYDKIHKATTGALEHLGIHSFGTVPYEPYLSAPSMKQVYHLLGGQVLASEDGLDNRVLHTIVAAMEASHVVPYIRPGTLVITPGDRSDSILAAVSAHLLADGEGANVAGIVLTGGFEPAEAILKLVRGSKIPLLVIEGDTYGAASKLRETVFKITPGDRERGDWAVKLIADYVQVDDLIEQLQ